MEVMCLRVSSYFRFATNKRHLRDIKILALHVASIERLLISYLFSSLDKPMFSFAILFLGIAYF